MCRTQPLWTARGLRKVVYGSAPTTPAMIRRALATVPDAETEQWYGATEGAGG